MRATAGQISQNTPQSIDEFHFPTQGFRGLALRLFDPVEETWSIYWVSTRDGKLQPPVKGRFHRGIGEFEGDYVHEGQAIRVRCRRSDISGNSARWLQAYSADRGRSWETNWQMDFTRTAIAP